jgi:phage baseplate assembly protein W
MSTGLVIDDNGPRVASGKEQMHSRIERLFFTQEGGILGHPQWGSRILEYLYEPSDEEMANEIINEMSFLLNEQDSIEIDEVSVELIGTDSGSNGVILKVNAFEDSQATIPEPIEFFRIVEI